MKYINKKLPFMEIGKEVEWYEEQTGVHIHDSGNVYCEKEMFNNLISEGWIEEVKPREPREWWEVRHKDVPMHKTEDAARRFFCDVVQGDQDRYEIIKVRECLDE